MAAWYLENQMRAIFIFQHLFICTQIYGVVAFRGTFTDVVKNQVKFFSYPITSGTVLFLYLRDDIYYYVCE